MSRGNLKNTDLEKWVKAGAPIAGKSDGGGLTFTLSSAGTASWVFRYRHAGKQREMTLGNYHARSGRSDAQTSPRPECNH